MSFRGKIGVSPLTKGLIYGILTRSETLETDTLEGKRMNARRMIGMVVLLVCLAAIAANAEGAPPAHGVNLGQTVIWSSADRAIVTDKDQTLLVGWDEVNGWVTQPALSPDGKDLAVTVDDAGAYLRNIWSKDLVNGDLSWLARGEQPAWSPDGKSLLSVDTGVEPWAKIMVTDVKNPKKPGQPVRLTDNWYYGVEGNPCADGDEVAFDYKDVYYHNEILMAWNTKTGESRPLIDYDTWGMDPYVLDGLCAYYRPDMGGIWQKSMADNLPGVKLTDFGWGPVLAPDHTLIFWGFGLDGWYGVYSLAPGETEPTLIANKANCPTASRTFPALPALMK